MNQKPQQQPARLSRVHHFLASHLCSLCANDTQQHPAQTVCDHSDVTLFWNGDCNISPVILFSRKHGSVHTADITSQWKHILYCSDSACMLNDRWNKPPVISMICSSSLALRHHLLLIQKAIGASSTSPKHNAENYWWDATTEQTNLLSARGNHQSLTEMQFWWLSLSKQEAICFPQNVACDFFQEVSGAEISKHWTRQQKYRETYTVEN